MANNAVTLKGVTRALRELRALPVEIQRAERNTTGIVLTEANRRILDVTFSQTGLKKKEQRRQLIVKRPKQGEVSGSITARDRPIPLRHYRVRKHRVSPTQVGISVKDEIGKPARRSSSAFINPKFRQTVILRRARSTSGERVGRLPVAAVHGPSMAVHMDEILSDSFQNQIAGRYREVFSEKLNNQLNKRR